MFDRLGKDALGRPSKGSRAQSKAGNRLRIEPLEGRALLAATLAPIPSVTVEATAGYQVPLSGDINGNTDPQTFTATTDNSTSGITVTPATGEFWTIGVSHTSSGAGDPAFTGTLTFQLFQDLTPNSVAKIESLINGTVPFGDLTTAAQAAIYPNGQGTTGQDYYTATNGGNKFTRVQNDFPDVNSYVFQAGALVPPLSGQVFATPYANETSPQLVFNGTGQLALANSGGTSSNDAQFFVTTGSPGATLNGGFTIFGQLVAGASTLAEMSKVAGTTIPSSNGPLGITPTSPIVITSSTLSKTSPDGVLHINAINATANTLTNVTVTATDTLTNQQTFQTFPVITIPTYTTQPATTPPTLNPVTTPISTGSGTPVSFQLSSTNPSNATLSYVVYGGLTAGTTTTGPAFNSTIANGSATVSSTGMVTVTPNAGYTGPINLVVGVTDGVNRAGSTLMATSPANYSLQNVVVSVGSFTTAPTITPIASPISASISQTVHIQLSATNPSGGMLSYTVQGGVSSGAFTAIPSTEGTASVDANGLVSVVPAAGYTGPIDVLVGVRDQTDRSGTGVLDTPSNYSTESLVINVAAQASTGAVRFIQDSSTSDSGNLVVTPLPQTGKKATNTILITQNDGDAEVIVNGVVDQNQPALNNVESIIVYGSKAKDRITVDPSVTVPVTLSSGTGGSHVLTAGGGPTREQGWYGTTVEKQGESNNYLFGQKGKVTFVQGSGTNDVTFAGTPGKARGQSRIRHLPPVPKGTYYKFNAAGKLVPTSNPFTTPAASSTTNTTTTTASTASTKAKKK